MAKVLWTDLAKEKGPFFRVLHSTTLSQTGVMTVPAGGEAGPVETHARSDRLLHVVAGEAEVEVWSDGPARPSRKGRVGPGGLVVVPAGMQHHVRSVGEEPLYALTAYSPPAY